MTDNDLEQLGMDAIAADIAATNQERTRPVYERPDVRSHMDGQVRSWTDMHGIRWYVARQDCFITCDCVLRDHAWLLSAESPQGWRCTCGNPSFQPMKPLADPYAGIRQFADPATELKAQQASTIGRIMEAYFDGQHECQVSDRVRLLEILRQELEGNEAHEGAARG